MKLLLHIGGEKTGSSSLQQFLTQNAQLLRQRHGIVYPESGSLFYYGAHFPVAAVFASDHLADFLPPAHAVSEELLSNELRCLGNQSDTEICVLSAEHFSSRLDSDGVGALLNVIRNTGAFSSVRIVFFVRPQDELAISSNSTALRCGWQSWLHLDAADPRNLYYNHAIVARAWADHIGEDALTLREYFGGHTRIIPEFMGLLGVQDLSPYQLPKRINEALTYQEARVLYLVNQHLFSYEEARARNDMDLYRRCNVLRTRILDVITNHSTFSLSTSLSGAYTSEQRHSFREIFRESNEEIFVRYGVDLMRDTGAERAGVGENETNPANSDSDSDLLTEALIALAEAHTITRESRPT